jgi:hypothetical protein
MIEIIVAGLAKKGLDLIAGAVMRRGTEFIKEKTGIDLQQAIDADGELGDQDAAMLQEYQETNRAEILTYLTEKDKTALEREKLTFTDTVDARAMQRSIAAGPMSDIGKLFVYILAGYVVVMSTLYIGFITFGTIPPDNVRFADVVLGFVMGTMLTGVLNFFFGSTRNNQSKDETIARALNG